MIAAWVTRYTEQSRQVSSGNSCLSLEVLEDIHTFHVRYS